MLPTLYKRTSTGKVQIWSIVVSGASYYTISGQLDGKKVQSEPTVCMGKNPGKANATTDEEQAELEAASKWRKKRDSGYTESEGDVDTAVEGRVNPMLAQTYDDAVASPKHSPKFPVISQPKLDGIRCIVTREAMMSRKWKPIVACPHVHAALTGLFEAHPELIALDGELYNHEFKAEFPMIVSLVRKTTLAPEDLEAAKQWVEYHVYDCILDKNSSNAHRYVWMETHVRDLPKPIRLVDTKFIGTQEELDAEYQRLMEHGYEGQMVRTTSGMYEHKRSWNLLKRKEFVDGEFRIVGYEDCVGNRAGTCSFVCEYTDGRTFVVPMDGTVEYLRGLYAIRDTLIGEYCSVAYFPPPAGCLPRFPRGRCIRPVENGDAAL